MSNRKVYPPFIAYCSKVIPLAFNESMSYYECICNITNHINNEIIPKVNENTDIVNEFKNEFIELKNYVDDNMLTKDINDLTYYTLTSDLSTVALTGNYNDLSNKPTIPDVSNFITKDVNDLTYYTLSENLSTVATTGDYDDLTNKPTIPDISNMVTTDTEQSITGQKSFKTVIKIENGQGTGSLWVGGNVNNNTVTNNQRHLARIVVPSYSNITLGATLLGFDTSGDSDMHVTNKTYDVVSFGGMKKISNATSPMAIGFCVTNSRESTSINNKIYPLEMDSSEARFNVQPNYNGNNLITSNEVTTLLSNKEDIIEKGSNSNGYYIKFADGTLIQYGKLVISSLACTTGYGSFYYGTTTAITFPIQFNNLYSLTPTLQSNGIGSICVSQSSVSNFTCRCINGTSGNISATIFWIAIGN